MTTFAQADRRRLELSGLLDQLATAAPLEDGSTGAWVTLVNRHLEEPYLVALVDLLEVLGLIRRRGLLTAAALSPQAGYMLRQLSDFLSQPEPLLNRSDLKDVGQPGVSKDSTIVSILTALDQRRLDVFGPRGTAPVREIQAVVALIVREHALQGTNYLLVYDKDAGEWQLPGGRVEQQDSTLYDAMLRELGEEVTLRPLTMPADVSIERIGRPFRLTRNSPTQGLLTTTTFCPFIAHFTEPLTELHSDVRWITLTELDAEQTRDGQRINVAQIRPMLQYLPTALKGVTP